MDWYFAPAALICIITTVLFLAGAISFGISYTGVPEYDRKNARMALAVLLGYVVAFTWPVSIPLGIIIGIGFLIKKAFPQTDKDNK